MSIDVAESSLSFTKGARVQYVNQQKPDNQGLIGIIQSDGVGQNGTVIVKWSHPSDASISWELLEDATDVTPIIAS